MKLGLWLTMLAAASSVCAEDGPAVPDALQNYVSRPEPDFAWKSVGDIDTEAGRVHQLRVTSQKWHDIVWQHAVEVYEPEKLIFPGHALLFVNGGNKPGSPDEGDMKMGLQLAQMCGARVVMLHQVPNQPLFGGRTEDDLITDTWLKYLETGDETWPLLFPMVKSAVKTMDAVQELAETEWDQSIDHFVITGASKRGWTSWLTPVVDKRICATAPIVIDVLNFRAQMNHQLESWGKFSEQIIDYTSKGLVKRPDESESPREAALRTMMDPFTYRQQLTLPKLLIVGTNDPYWVVDAMNLYWDDLKGQRYIRQVPNAGHGLDGGRDSALTTLAIFFRHVAAAHELPEHLWTLADDDNNLTLTMTAAPSPENVRFWTATSDDLDFRDDRWTSTELPAKEAKWVGQIDVPTSGHVAVFGELEFHLDGHPWSLTTLVYRR
ncbi:MAG: phenylacetic acid degradation protein [Fuerstiella sp.]|nr:phenylacetic acid degradation protein [Fuerstiella sp.]MCP4857183.1 phenylacetic acid degradation protein [Fuerstiella sp.]